MSLKTMNLLKRWSFIIAKLKYRMVAKLLKKKAKLEEILELKHI